MDLENTIASIATAPGNGAIAIIRISGKQAVEIADKVFSQDVKKLLTHRATYGKILSKSNSVIDEVLLISMLAPRSFTGEDVIEIHCHGGHFVTKKILNRIYEAGAVPAEPGEFTFRAFKNNKIDLTQAESIQKIISAKNDQALQSAEHHLQGALHKKIDFYQKELTEMCAIMEASVDFPEDDLEFTTQNKFSKRLDQLIKDMKYLESTFEMGKVLHQGVTLCLCGSVNVGKSSLLNALLRKDRAIVTNIEGTTRDLLEEDLYLKNFHLKAIDTAGFRDASDLVEQEGIKRSKKAIESSDIVLFVLDSEKGISEKEYNLYASLPKEKTLVVWNKSDIKKVEKNPFSNPSVSLSAKNNQGIDLLVDLIEKQILKSNYNKEEIILTEKRHKVALTKAIECCQVALDGLSINQSPEFVASDLKEGLKYLANIIGIDVTEDILDSIFSQFCLGK